MAEKLATLYCKHCDAQTLPTDDGLCGWCDHPLLDVVNEPVAGGNLRQLPPNAKEAGKHRWYKERKDRGRPRTFTVEQAEEAWTWYEQGMSLRQCAARLYPDTTAASVKSCANTLHNAWLKNGHQLRDRVEATVAASTVHGLARRKQRDPAHQHALRVARGEVRGVQCMGVTVKGIACSKPALAGGEWCVYHDPVRGQGMQEALAQARRRAYAEKRDGVGGIGDARPRGERSGSRGRDAATAACATDHLDHPGLHRNGSGGQGDQGRDLRVGSVSHGGERPVQGTVPTVLLDPARGEAAASGMA